jgi:4-amino-4-deoxy-L-arabinose transferase-like glycosyltransferase
VNVGFFLLLAVACLLLPRFLEEDPAMPNFRSALEASGVNIHGAIILTVSAIAVAIVLLFPNLITRLRLPGNPIDEVQNKTSHSREGGNPKLLHRGDTIWTMNLIGFLAFFIVAVMPTMLIFDAERQQPVREMAAILRQERQPQEEIVMIAFEKPSLVFYSHQPVTFFRRSTDAYNYLKAKAEKEKAEAASEPTSLLILGWPNKLRGAGLRSRHYQGFYEVEPYQLVRVNLDIFRTIEIKD